MAYKHCTASHLFFPTYIEEGDEKRLLHWLERRHDLDFGDYEPRGGGTTFAHLRWLDDDGVVLFEGVDVPERRISADVPSSELVSLWTEFAAKVREAHQLRHSDRDRGTAPRA